MNQEIKLYQSVVTGIGASLPKKIVTNKDLTKIVDTTEEWIVERTGIQERRIASDNETTVGPDILVPPGVIVATVTISRYMDIRT